MYILIHVDIHLCWRTHVDTFDDESTVIIKLYCIVSNVVSFLTLYNSEWSDHRI